jgi:ribonuclease P protein component
VLPPAARMRRSGDFALAVRRGRRAGRGAVVVHYLAPPEPAATQAAVPVPAVPAVASVAQVGFVVGRAVGGAVRRNRVTRQLRHLMRDRLDRLPGGARLVVRAQPSAFGRSSAELGRDLDGALARLLRDGLLGDGAR